MLVCAREGGETSLGTDMMCDRPVPQTRPTGGGSLLRRGAVLAALLLLLAAPSACTRPTPYQPADGGYGFAERRLEENRYLVTFSGNSATPREEVELYLLYRAAQLTLDSGNDHFVLVERDTEADTTYLAEPTFYGPPCWGPWRPGYGGWVYGPWGPAFAPGYWAGWGCPGWGAGRAIPITRYQAQAEIQVFPGPVPEGNPAAYDARQVLANLQPQIRLPSPGRG